MDSWLLENLLLQSGLLLIHHLLDDANGCLTSDAEFVEVDRLVGWLESLSGAILNRDCKSKVMGLGSWCHRNVWPLPWLSTVQKMKVFGFILHPCYKTMLQLNWEAQLTKVNNTLFSWSNRSINSLYERAKIIRTFVLSRV